MAVLIKHYELRTCYYTYLFLRINWGNPSSTCNLLHDSLFIVIPQWSTEFVVVHCWSVFLSTPSPCDLERNYWIYLQPVREVDTNFFRFYKLELHSPPRPRYASCASVWRVQKGNEELPQLQGSPSSWPSLYGPCVRSFPDFLLPSFF